MKSIVSVLALCLACVSAGYASELSERVWSLEKKGDLIAARELLEHTALAPGATASDLADWAEYWMNIATRRRVPHGSRPWPLRRASSEWPSRGAW